VKKDKNTFTQKEIASSINNAIVFAKAPNRTGEISEARLKKLRNYSIALFTPLMAEIDEEFVSPEEAVLICLTGAMFFHMKYIMKTDKMPVASTVEAALQKHKEAVYSE